MREQKDFGLLILRGAGLLLAELLASKRSAGIGRPFMPGNLYHLPD